MCVCDIDTCVNIVYTILNLIINALDDTHLYTTTTSTYIYIPNKTNIPYSFLGVNCMPLFGSNRREVTENDMQQSFSGQTLSGHVRLLYSPNKENKIHSY